MANETTSTSVTEYVNSEWIRPVMGQAAKAAANFARFGLQVDLRGKGTGTASLGREESDISNPPTEIDIATEVTDLANIEFQTTAVTISTSEYGIMRKVTDVAGEDSILGQGGLYNRIVISGANDLAIGIDSDYAALLAAFSVEVGDTTLNLTLASMVQAMAKLRAGDMRGPGGAVYNIHTQLALDYEAALAASGSTTINNYHTKPEGTNGLEDGDLGTFMGSPVITNSLPPTANGGADRTGAVYLRGDEGRNPESHALAVAYSRFPTPEIQRVAKSRAAEVVVSMRAGAVENADEAGVSIVGDAT